jgi:FtsP/CotA-like multicopper oxidase with cupredoxin domain
MPFVNIPQQQCRLRIVNGANARSYNLNLPFFKKCKLVASDSGFLKNPVDLSPVLEIFPLERRELLCDFRDSTVFSRNWIHLG